jgi:hypothetical protein
LSALTGCAGSRAHRSISLIHFHFPRHRPAVHAADSRPIPVAIGVPTARSRRHSAVRSPARTRQGGFPRRFFFIIYGRVSTCRHAISGPIFSDFDGLRVNPRVPEPRVPRRPVHPTSYDSFRALPISRTQLMRPSPSSPPPSVHTASVLSSQFNGFAVVAADSSLVCCRSRAAILVAIATFGHAQMTRMGATGPGEPDLSPLYPYRRIFHL